MSVDIHHLKNRPPRTFGVVLWHDSRTGRGLIWCEDQQELAVLDPAVLRGAGTNLAANDRVIFEEDRRGGQRQVKCICEYWSVPSEEAALSRALLGTSRPGRALRVVHGGKPTHRRSR